MNAKTRIALGALAVVAATRHGKHGGSKRPGLSVAAWLNRKKRNKQAKVSRRINRQKAA